MRLLSRWITGVSVERPVALWRAVRAAAAIAIAGSLAVPVSVASAEVAGAASRSVTNCSGSAAVPGSLPAAIAHDGSGKKITFAVSCPASSPIELSAPLDLATDLTIDGPGAGSVVVSGRGTTGVLTVGLAATVTLTGMTVEDGSADLGGGIDNQGTLTLADVAVTNDTASQGGGVYNAGTVTIDDSTLSGDTAPGGGGTDAAEVADAHALTSADDGFGGGLINFGDAAIDDSTLSGDSASEAGGGILNGGVLTVATSTLSGNSVTSTGSEGGGLFDDGTLLMTSSTVADDDAPPGGGGGIYEAGNSSSVAGTIVADNEGGDCAGAVADAGYNLADDGSCGFSAANGSQSGVDPDLGPLQDNGGPTETQEPGPSSPALDRVPFGTVVDHVEICPGTDQRGVARPQSVDCDLGAVEPVLPQAITSPDGATATAGTYFSFTVTTSGTPTPRMTRAGRLPKGVTFANDYRTALLYGTPGPRSPGTYPITITATFGSGIDKTEVTQAFTLTVDPS